MTQTNITDKVTRAAIVANGKYQSRRVASKLFAIFKEDERFYLPKKDSDVVISISGDGTLSSAFHMYEKNLDKVCFVRIHIGHPGFYTDYRDFEVEKLIENLYADKGRRVSYPILRAKVTLDNGRMVKACTLNEVAIRRIEKMMVADVVIDKAKLERFRGDGLSVSALTGNTGYSKSLGGAILHPTMETLQLTEISSLNNRVHRTLGSPVIVLKKDKIEIIPKCQGVYTISIDNKMMHYKSVSEIEYCIDNKKISFVAAPFHTSFRECVTDVSVGELES